MYVNAYAANSSAAEPLVVRLFIFYFAVRLFILLRMLFGLSERSAIQNFCLVFLYDNHKGHNTLIHLESACMPMQQQLT